MKEKKRKKVYKYCGLTAFKTADLASRASFIQIIERFVVFA